MSGIRNFDVKKETWKRERPDGEREFKRRLDPDSEINSESSAMMA